MKDKYSNLRVKAELDKTKLPEPIYDAEPGFIELYWKAWELAWKHVIYQPGMPQPKYIDESYDPHTNWIWDTCFMALFCKYGFEIFPGIESLDNFYYIMHENAPFVAKIEHPDNPPLFAWVEWEYFKFTGNFNRLKLLFEDKQFLQKHFDWIEQSKRRRLYKFSNIWGFAQKRDYGFQWSGVASGMDNTPRGNTKYSRILWLDLATQQALSALYISKIARYLGHKEKEEYYHAKYQDYKNLMNKWYWNEEIGCYFDISKKNPKIQYKILTPASFWPMLAEICSETQAQKMKTLVEDSNLLGGEIPLPSVARNDRSFHPNGRYWKGSVWLPTAYMVLKALEKFDFLQTANNLGEKILYHMLKTYDTYEPHTIWEAYSPTKPEPATTNSNLMRVKPDFCGWSALGPICVFIENVLGFHDINAVEKKITWNIHHNCRHGIKNLRFGNIITSIIFENGLISVETNESYLLNVNGNQIQVKSGIQTLRIKL